MEKQNNKLALLKWVGGKSKLIPSMNNMFPKNINNYYELFVGGGSILLYVLENIRNNNIKITGNIYAYDINKNLINFYKQIQSNCEEFYISVKKLIDEYNKCKNNVINRNPNSIDEALENKENYYYWIRKQYNNTSYDTLENAAYFIFLNKTCFRGLYREGKNGFNVPYGHYKNPSILKYDDLIYVSNLIKCVVFKDLDFKESLKEINGNDCFVFLDPPYIKDNVKTFVSYNNNGFGKKETKYLIETIKNKQCNFTLCNYENEIIKNEFKNNSYKKQTIQCCRYINSKDPSKKETEIFITNIN